MDQKQWKVATSKVSDDDKKEFFYFRNLAVKELGLRKGYVIHHLRDTEEQRIFNDTYYERWGYDFDGVCKYCVLMKVEDHRAYHRLSEETRKKISDSNKATKSTAEYKERISGKNSYMYGKHRELSDEAKQKISEGIKEFFKDEDNRIARSNALKEYYKNNPRTDENKKRISDATKLAMASEEVRNKISSGLKGNTNRKGKHASKETKEKASLSSFARKASPLYKEYKDSGGMLNWNQWQKAGYPVSDIESTLNE